MATWIRGTIRPRLRAEEHAGELAGVGVAHGAGEGFGRGWLAVRAWCGLGAVASYPFESVGRLFA